MLIGSKISLQITIIYFSECKEKEIFLSVCYRTAFLAQHSAYIAHFLHFPPKPLITSTTNYIDKNNYKKYIGPIHLMEIGS